MITRYSRDALKFLSKLDEKSVNRIKKAINGLKKSPPEGDIRSMQGFSDNRKRLRLGSWRIIFRYDSEDNIVILLILDIDNRGDIYK